MSTDVATEPQVLNCMRVDDYNAANAARQRLRPKSRLPKLLSLSSLHLPHKESSPRSRRNGQDSTQSNARQADDLLPLANDNLIRLDRAALTERGDKDEYRWAIIYENQRGMTLFSTPYYSKMSLLPTDPSPFTVPDTSVNLSKQPEVSLTEYPLPDGTWRWVSKCWMIDMRSDSGEVQHDGFEYNWMFRQHKWRAEVGALSTGGWVRRRRWVRLMMRPAPAQSRLKKMEDQDASPRLSPSTSWGTEIGTRNRHSNGSLYPPSVFTHGSDIADEQFEMHESDIWKGEDAEADWARCHLLMKVLGRDGRKLEQWRRWLGLGLEHMSVDSTNGNMRGERKSKQTIKEDASLSASQGSGADTHGPPIKAIKEVLQAHGDALLHSFIFPESRAQFLAMLGHVRLLQELNTGLGGGFFPSEVDFWSYVNEAEGVIGDPTYTSELHSESRSSI